MREKFTDRHGGITIDVPHKYPGRHEPDIYTITYARLPSGKIAEFWLHAINGCEKLINYDMPDTCASVSRGLQHGDTIEQLSRSAQRDNRGRPLGWLGSVYDALKREPVDA